jgi:hypothetical protein
MGLLDIPTSIGGGEEPDEQGEVLTFKGTPQNPGLSREMGDDEETDFFGASEEGVDISPKNTKYQSKINSDGEVMINELDKLEKHLRRAGKLSEARSIAGMIKRAQEKYLGGGSAIEENFDPALLDYYYDQAVERMEESSSQIYSELKAMAASGGYANPDPSATLNPIIEGWKGKIGNSVLFGENSTGAIESELTNAVSSWLTSNQISHPDDVINGGVGEMISKLAKSMNLANIRAVAMQGESSPDVSTQPLEQGGSIGGRAPAASPAREGSIKRPGDPYTYDKNPDESDSYVVVSHWDKELNEYDDKGVGNVISPPSPAYDLVKAADPAAQADAVPERTVTKPEGEVPAVTPEAPEVTEDANVEAQPGPGEVRIRQLPNEKKTRIMEALKLNSGDSNHNETKYQEWLSLPKTLYQGPIESSGRQIGIVDFGEEFPTDIRYDGIASEDGESWYGSPLSRRDRIALKREDDSKLKGRDSKGIRQELRRENRRSNTDTGTDPNRDDTRKERREERQRGRVNTREDRRRDRRERARKESRLLQIKDLYKTSKSA